MHHVVYVRAGLVGNSRQAHSRLGQVLAAFAVVAHFACAHEVSPGVGAPFAPGYYMVYCEVANARTTILAGVIVADKDFAPA